jgi:hypothetical protein
LALIEGYRGNDGSGGARLLPPTALFLERGDCGLPDDDETLAQLSKLGKAWYARAAQWCGRNS